MKNFLYIFFITPFFTPTIGAQSINDECFNAIELTNVFDWCSEGEPFNNFSATSSGFGPATCFSNGGKDVWYSFTAIASDITIVIKNGSLANPEAALYIGNCNGTLNELACAADVPSNGVLQLYKGGLFTGQVYFLRVQGEEGTEGNFNICLNNYFPPINPGSDCNTASVLCNKETFVVQKVEGVGLVKKEFDDAPCLADPNLTQESETNSTWFKWTCDTAGTLTFTLFPLNEPDDLDFALYELNGDIVTCVRTVVRCMASSCKGATGLREGANDVSEPPNCGPGQDNWLAPLMMESGKSYMLGVNNFSNTGNGFKIEFGGTGTFVGPKPDFDIIADEVVCREEQISVVDKTVFNLGTIDSTFWIFGQDATPVSSNTPGNQDVSYLKRGNKWIVLTVVSDKGCRVSKAKMLDVDCCGPGQSVTVGPEATINLGDSINLTAGAVLEGNQIFYFWQPTSFIKCQGCPSNNLTLFSDQWVLVTATDEFNCTITDSVQIRVNENRPVYIPNIFTPNHDGINDRFTVYSNQAVTVVDYLRVYNRWGACVFETKDIQPNDESLGWNGFFRGKPVNPDVYVYVTSVKFIDGLSLIYKGSITLVR